MLAWLKRCSIWWSMNLTKASYCSPSFCCRILSYSARTLSVLSWHIFSQMSVICLRVKIGFSLLLEDEAAAFIGDSDDAGEVADVEDDWLRSALAAARMAEASSIMGSGLDGGLQRLGICFLFLSLLSSSLRFAATSAGVRAVSLNTEAPPSCCCCGSIPRSPPLVDGDDELEVEGPPCCVGC